MLFDNKRYGLEEDSCYWMKVFFPCSNKPCLRALMLASLSTCNGFPSVFDQFNSDFACYFLRQASQLSEVPLLHVTLSIAY
jgi:hypothetical protein